MLDPKLLPCPFCGGSPKAHIWEMQNDDRYAGVECTECFAEMPKAVAWMDDGEKELGEAIAAWNRRAYLTAAGEPARQGLFGPYGWLNGLRALNEEGWALEDEPIVNSEKYFSIPLFALVDPFDGIGDVGSTVATRAPCAEADGMIDAAYEVFAGKMLMHEEDRNLIRRMLVAALSVAARVQKTVVPCAVENAFRAGFDDGEAVGKFDDDNVEDAWSRYASIIPATPAPDERAVEALALVERMAALPEPISMAGASQAFADARALSAKEAGR